MSRIGRRPVEILEGVKASVENNKLKVAGPKGTLERTFPSTVKIKVEETAKKIIVECPEATKENKMIHGLSRSVINNMVIGVFTGYEKKLEIHGTGYNAKLQGTDLILQIGLSHPVKMPVPKGITVTIPNPNLVVIQGTDKELVGQFSANIRFVKPAEPYNLKGIKYTDEVIRRKAGKTFVSGT